MQIERFLEAAVLLKDCNHKNVLPLAGITITRNLPCSLYSHMEHGDLKTHLCELRDTAMVCLYIDMSYFNILNLHVDSSSYSLAKQDLCGIFESDS